MAAKEKMSNAQSTKHQSRRFQMTKQTGIFKEDLKNDKKGQRRLTGQAAKAKNKRVGN